MARKSAEAAAVPAGIQLRAPHQYRVQLKRNGVYQTKTFETVEGKVTGDEFVNLRRARATTLAAACDWMPDGKLYGNNPDAKNVAATLRYWKHSKFADWSLASLHDWDLILI
jgi:hypothetical protein